MNKPGDEVDNETPIRKGISALRYKSFSSTAVFLGFSLCPNVRMMELLLPTRIQYECGKELCSHIHEHEYFSGGRGDFH